MMRQAGSPSAGGDNQAQMLDEMQRLAEYAQRLMADLENSVDQTSHRLVAVSERAEDLRAGKLNPLVSQLRGQDGKDLVSKRANEKRFKPTRGFGYTVSDVFKEETRPAEMSRLRHACRETPDFSVFEKVSPGSSLKFSNPGFFYQEWIRAQTKQTEEEERKLSEEKEARKRNKERKKKLDTSTLSAPEGGESTQIPGGSVPEKPPMRPARVPRPPSQSGGLVNAPPPPEAPRRIARPPSTGQQSAPAAPAPPARAPRPASTALGSDGMPLRPPRAGGGAPAPERPTRQPSATSGLVPPAAGPDRPPRAGSMRNMVETVPMPPSPQPMSTPPPPLPRPMEPVLVSVVQPQPVPAAFTAPPMQEQQQQQANVTRPARSRPTPPPPPPPGATPVESLPIHATDKAVDLMQARPKRAQAPPPPPSSQLVPDVSQPVPYEPVSEPVFEADMPAKRAPMAPLQRDEEEEEPASEQPAPQEEESVSSALLNDPVLRKFALMQKMNMPQGAIEQAMIRAQVDPALLFGESANLKLGGSAPVVIKIEPRREAPPAASRPASIMDEIAQGGRVLRKVETPPTPSSGSSSSELMQGILSQKDKLKRVEAPPPEAKKAAVGHLDGGGVASILARRIAIIGDKGSDDDDDSAGSEWDEDD